MGIMDKLTQDLTFKFSCLRDWAALFFRLILAYGFFDPAMKKVMHFSDIVIWFRDGLNLPFPEVNAFMATSTEVLGVALLILGLATRFISVPLIVVMFVAVVTVHGFENFSAADNGFEVPLYYALMLFGLVANGAGKFSLDETVFKKYFGGAN